MNKKTALLLILTFAVGLVIGGFSVWLYKAIEFAGMVTSINQLMGFHYRVKWLAKAYQSYLYEDPSIAIWALENAEDILSQDAEKLEFAEHKKEIMTDLMLTRVRLAISYQRLNKIQKYEEYLTKAFEIAQKYSSHSFGVSREALLEKVNKLDDSNKSRSKKASSSGTAGTSTR